MKTLRELLQDADPVRHEPNQPVLQERARRRDAVISGANSRTTPSTQLWRSRMPLLAAAMLLLATAVVEFYLRAPGTVDLQAAVRFEVRLAEDSPAAGLQAARVGSDRAIYLHPEAIVSNSDVAHARVVPGNSASRFGVGIEFKAAGAQKMRTATAGHFGKPLAILIDGKVVMAPTVRSPIDALAEINGDLTRAEAERIVNGIGVH